MLHSAEELGDYIHASFRGVGANVRDYDIAVSEFEIHLLYGVHFQTNTLGKSIIALSNGLISTTAVFLLG